MLFFSKVMHFSWIFPTSASFYLGDNRGVTIARRRQKDRWVSISLPRGAKSREQTRKSPAFIYVQSSSTRV